MPVFRACNSPARYSSMHNMGCVDAEQIRTTSTTPDPATPPAPELAPAMPPRSSLLSLALQAPAPAPSPCTQPALPPTGPMANFNQVCQAMTCFLKAVSDASRCTERCSWYRATHDTSSFPAEGCAASAASSMFLHLPYYGGACSVRAPARSHWRLLQLQCHSLPQLKRQPRSHHAWAAGYPLAP